MNYQEVECQNGIDSHPPPNEKDENARMKKDNNIRMKKVNI